MKIYTLSRELNEGTIFVPTSSSNEGRLFSFPLETLFDWYPCCPRYEYQYSTSRKKLYLRLLDSDKTLVARYGVGDNKKRVISKIACFNENEWYNEEVANENAELFNFAEQYDIVTPLKDDYTLKEVDDSISKVLDILDLLYTNQKVKVEEELINKVDTLQLSKPYSDELKQAYKDISEYMRLDREEKATYVLSRSLDSLNSVYEKFGNVYTMLNIMRKVVA
ncbi:hypothetical protein NGDEOPKE_00132 [Enterococcus phage vB_OCPT_Carl]|uniref:Uncharacterized protein n=1 Tax=Enterococcus phage vB_OCPT_Car TaxID=2922319 RepID=A0A9E7J2A3_9CAUD|nr:hypothetical protein NGDEOPKE_00132 [Enterococcus phage vB_OCPT_Carl]UQT00296.1 hypothetical protein EGEOBHOM_00144 [Enterococcus phage vB_OCPT_Car]